RNDLLALRGELLVTGGDDPVALLLRLGLHIREDLLPLGAGVVADLGRLTTRLGELCAVLGQLFLGLGLGLLCTLQTALDPSSRSSRTCWNLGSTNFQNSQRITTSGMSDQTMSYSGGMSGCGLSSNGRVSPSCARTAMTLFM